MKSLVLTEYKKLEIQDMPVPDVGPREVRIRVHSCGICGSDVHGFDGSSGRRIPPLIMGHEAAGTVDATGNAVKGLKPGDRVTFDSMISCGVSPADSCLRSIPVQKARPAPRMTNTLTSGSSRTASNRSAAPSFARTLPGSAQILVERTMQTKADIAAFVFLSILRTPHRHTWS